LQTLETIRVNAAAADAQNDLCQIYSEDKYIANGVPSIPNLVNTYAGDNVQLGLVSMIFAKYTDRGSVVFRTNVGTSQYTSLVDWPLFCVVLSAQIKQGMWRLNGQVMADQFVNYAEPPFCRVYRDLDLLLVQFFSSGDLGRAKA